MLRDHPLTLVLGTLGAFATFVLFYLMTVFTLGHGTTVLGYSREQFLLLQMVGILFFAAGIPISALYGDRWGTRRTMIVASGLILAFGVVFAPLFQAGSPWLVLGVILLAGAGVYVVSALI